MSARDNVIKFYVKWKVLFIPDHHCKEQSLASIYEKSY